MPWLLFDAKVFHIGLSSATMDSRKQQVRRFYDALWNARDKEAVREVLHENCKFRGSLGQEMRGHSGFRDYVDMVHEALADYRCCIDELVAEGEKVVARVGFSGVHRGQLMGYPPSGGRVSWLGVATFTFDGELISDVWVLGDLAELEKQIQQNCVTHAISSSAPADGQLLVRAYEDDDRDSVVGIWARAGLVVPQNNPHRDIDRKLRMQPDWFLVATLGDALVGTCMAGYDGHRGWIYYLAVDPDQRRAGIARAMMTESERLLLEVGCPKINLQVRASNRQVISFYEHIGFQAEEIVSFGKRLIPDTTD